MGRRKIEIKPIRDDRNRSVTFLKRKGGLFKKAHELSVLCSVDVAVIIFGHNKKLYEYSSSNINEILGRYQYYGGAHEHKGPSDFADKGGDDDDDDDEGGDGGDERGTPAPEHPMMGMQHHPGFQHVRHGTPSGSPPTHNGAMPQFQRGPSPLPPNMSRPSSRTSQHPGHIRHSSANLIPPPQPQGQMPQPNYAYSPNPPFYNPHAAAAQMQARPGPSGPMPVGSTYPPPYPQPGAPHPHMQQVIMQDGRRASMPPGYPSHPQGPAPQTNIHRHASQEHLQPPPQQPSRHASPRPQHQGSPLPPPQQQQQNRSTPSPQPPQQEFNRSPIPQPKALPSRASHSIFTPIDDSRSMLAAHWGSTSNAEMPRSEPPGKIEGGGPRSASIDVAALQREKEAAARTSTKSPFSSPQPPSAAPPNKQQQRTASATSASRGQNMTRTNTNQSDAKRPRLKVQIPSEQSGDEGGPGSATDDTGTALPINTAGGGQHPGPSHGVVLPPPSPSAGALLSAGAQGPPNPFARPAPPMSTNPHAMNRDANHIETPISALPSRFMSDNLLPSPSTFYPEWGFGRSGDSNMLPSPLNFQTPVGSNGQGWREEDRKRQSEEDGGGDSKRPKM